MPRTAPAPVSRAWQTAAERDFLLALQRDFLSYFLDNQSPRTGLVLDRQRNFGPRRPHGLVSTAATGMGLIAVALASAEPHRLLPRAEAIARVRRAVETALGELPQTAGVVPHFLDSATGAVVGCDARSTIDTAWLVAGALWAAQFLGDARLIAAAARLSERIDWRRWTAADGRIAHGADAAGRLLRPTWDRLNGETVFLYVLAAGAEPARAWPAANWARLGRFVGEAGGLRFGSADLGLFVFQYGLDLLDPRGLPGGAALWADAATAAEANARVCRDAAERFTTYRAFWGLSAGDGPGPAGTDVYRCYAPAVPLDGTAHVTATVASLEHRPALVWENLCRAAARNSRLRGRYGFANVNRDRAWVGGDVVGIDAGAAVLALDNCLAHGRIRRIFHEIEPIRCGLERLAGSADAARVAA